MALAPPSPAAAVDDDDGVGDGVAVPAVASLVPSLLENSLP
jgi:hypothetical protein